MEDREIILKLRTQKMRGTEDKEEPELRKKMKRIR
jgi:hypothetical protein